MAKKKAEPRAPYNGEVQTYVKVDTKNTKLATRDATSGRVISATSRTSNTCAPACPFLDKGEHNDAMGVPVCYANEKMGRPSIFQHAEKYGVVSTREAMDKLQYGAPKGSAVRHLVSGDVASEGDDYVDEANRMHAARKDLEGWGYTHDWSRMTQNPARNWTLNASTETPQQVKEALGKGFQAVIESPEGHSLHGTRIEGRKVITCPNQSTHGLVGCADCTLCRKDTPTRPIVEFIIHSTSKKGKEDLGGRVMAAREAANNGEDIAAKRLAAGSEMGPVRTTGKRKGDEFKEGFTARG